MKNKFKKLFTNIKISFVRIMLFLILQFIISFIMVFLVLAFIENNISTATISADKPFDPISLANTFMVFVTFILVAITLIITMASVWFAKSVSEKKIDIIRDNIEDIVASLLKDKSLKDEAFKEIIEQANVRELLKDHIEELTKAQKADFDKEIKEINKKMNDKIENIQKSIISVIDKKIQDSPEANELNELLGGKK